jgi:hypothetical protein
VIACTHILIVLIIASRALSRQDNAAFSANEPEAREGVQWRGVARTVVLGVCVCVCVFVCLCVRCATL